MLSSQLEIIAQGKSFLQQLCAEDYQKVISPFFSSSAGKHMRHILDHYLALMAGIEQGVIDYDVRGRDGDVEKDPALALQMWNNIEAWLTSLPESVFSAPLSVKCEVSVVETQIETTQSSLGRELVFVASHAVHHYSLLAIIAKHLGSDMDETFGLAPATASYVRDTGASLN